MHNTFMCSLLSTKKSQNESQKITYTSLLADHEKDSKKCLIILWKNSSQDLRLPKPYAGYQAGLHHSLYQSFSASVKLTCQ